MNCSNFYTIEEDGFIYASDFAKMGLTPATEEVKRVLISGVPRPENYREYPKYLNHPAGRLRLVYLPYNNFSGGCWGYVKE